MKKTILTVIALSLSFTLQAQEKPDQKDAKTKMEAFEAKTGSVLIKGIQEMGTINGTGTVTISCREFMDATSGKREYGITVRVKESGRLERSNTTLIDYDEIDSLLKGIDYISKIDKTATQLSGFEAVYNTKGDLRVISFSTRDGDIETAIQSGSIGSTTAYLTQGQLKHFRGYIQDAKTKIDEIKAK